MKPHKQLFVFVLLFLSLVPKLQAQIHEMIIEANKLGAPIQSTMYGLFFEDINYAADGGLYAELIKNRSFDFPQPFMGWKTFGNISIQQNGPFERNPNYTRLSYSGHDHKHTGLENEGFFGIGIRKDEDYQFSVWARALTGEEKIRIELIRRGSASESQVIAHEELTVLSTDWKKYELTLKALEDEPKAFFRIFLMSKGSVDLEHVSLFPKETWKNRKNGLRKDIAQVLADIKPGVFRFPGGCIVEGTELDDRYNWKNSIGAVENRPLNENRWQYTFQKRFFSDYYQTYGLGFYEYFLFAEDIGAEPLPVLNCGLVCQYQNKEMKCHVALDELNPYIQDALDLIEFANGDASSIWGKVRAEMGHPEPFHLKYIAIGNEQWGEEYSERLALFIKAIRKAYPKIQIIGGSGPGSEGEQFEFLWKEMRKLKVDLVDEHFYRPESWFLSQGARYDSYDRKGPKIFAGEYACHGAGKKYNHFRTALLEAAFMTGLERNADLVHMATYAPLLAHVEGWQWRPDLIWFDNLTVALTSSYYVQQLYAHNRGTHVLPLTLNKKPVTGAPGQNGLFASAVWDEEQQSYIVKIVNTSNTELPIKLRLNGLKKQDKVIAGTCTILQSDDLDKDNLLGHAATIKPYTQPIQIEGNHYSTSLPANTFAIYKFKKQ